MDRDVLLATIARRWQEWQSLRATLTAEQIREPGLVNGWAVMDVIAHIAFYEKWVGDFFLRTRTWAPAAHPSLDTWDMDARNAAYHELNRNRDHHLLAHPPDDDWRVAKMVDGNTFLHYPEHAATVRTWLGITAQLRSPRHITPRTRREMHGARSNTSQPGISPAAMIAILNRTRSPSGR